MVNKWCVPIYYEFVKLQGLHGQRHLERRDGTFIRKSLLKAKFIFVEEEMTAGEKLKDRHEMCIRDRYCV